MALSLNFSELSLTLTNNINKNNKKKDGVFFTSSICVDQTIDIIHSHLIHSEKLLNILEPSCGSCEYVKGLERRYPTKFMNITGIELNEEIFNELQKTNILLSKNINLNLIKDNFLTRKFDCEILYDLIIGNPPYYVMKRSDIDKCDRDLCTGRPNIFVAFLLKSLKLLNEGGILSFVLPLSFTNCLYYDKTRKHIIENFKIIDIVECTGSFIDTTQETIIFVVQRNNEMTNKDYTLQLENNTILTTKERVIELNKVLSNSTTLFALGFSVNVGNLVWNQHKEELTDDPIHSRLIYSSDIKNTKLIMSKFSNTEKKHYIDKDGCNDIVLVINRGYGVGKYKFNYCIIDVDYDFLIENHLICIKIRDVTTTRDQIKVKLNGIVNSFNDPRSHEFMKLYFGNNAINSQEMLHVFPIFSNQLNK